MKAVALANVFGGGTGWTLATTGDPLVAGFISRATAMGEDLIDEKISNLARAIRNEIADALNGNKRGAGS
jgi:hypothetical protein